MCDFSPNSRVMYPKAYLTSPFMISGGCLKLSKSKPQLTPHSSTCRVPRPPHPIVVDGNSILPDAQAKNLGVNLLLLSHQRLNPQEILMALSSGRVQHLATVHPLPWFSR